MSYLLGITIGPVQTYIEDSRKLRDLYSSSRIISDIAKETYKYIKSVSKDCKLIYPNYEDIDDVDYSNYMIFEIEDFIDLKSLENDIFNEFNYKIQDINKDINAGSQSFHKGYINIIKENFHLFWAMEEIVDNKYDEAYEKLTRLMLNIKNTYEFDQFEQISGKKCLICGKRNIVTPNLESKIRRKYMLNSDEELCSLCLFKRYYLKDEKLKSVYAVSIKNWKKDNEKTIKSLRNELKELFDEEDKYYNPNKVDNVIKILKLKEEIEIEKSKKIPKDLEKKINKIKSDLKDNVELKNALKRFEDIKKTMDKIYFNKVETQNIELPNYEYCFIQFDIDNLGCWMSGKYLEDKKDLRKYQTEFSNVLIRFSEKLRESLKGKCNIIYSGGDDFLSILPSENVIEVIEIIEKEFKNEIEKNLDKYMTYDRKITYSTSITIAQCKDPMSYALSKTRVELKSVKNRYENKEIEKNGVVINYIVSNGKEITCYLQQDNLEKYFQLIKEFEEVKSNLSFSYINNFQDEFIGFNLDNISFEQWRTFIRIAKYELKRLMLRSKMKKDNEEKAKEYIDKLVQFIENTISKNSNKIKSNEIIVDFKNIMNILKIYQKLCINNSRLIEYRRRSNDGV